MPSRREIMDGRNAGIDVLRGVAILMVLLLHFSLTYRLWRSGILYNLIGHDWAFSVLGWGNFAVTMFFVVSGFLIATNTAERADGLGKVAFDPSMSDASHA